MIGGLEACPQENLKNRSSEIEFGDVLESVYNASAH